MSELMDHVRLYQKLGFALLPLHTSLRAGDAFKCSCPNSLCASPAKHPNGRLVPNGCKDASNDPGTVEDWFGCGQHNVGIATGTVSQIIVLDVDPRHDGDETLADLEREYGGLLSTWRFHTGGGGEHILFRHPGGEVKNSAGRLGPGLDIRGDGGYIVAPPSLHITGRRYAISVDHHPDDIELAVAPDWLLEHVRPNRQGSSTRSPVDLGTLAGRGAVEGQRNDTIARLSGLLLGKRVDPHLCLDLMLAFNDSRCRPPLSDEEVARTVASIARREFLGRKEKKGGRSRG